MLNRRFYQRLLSNTLQTLFEHNVAKLMVIRTVSVKRVFIKRCWSMRCSSEWTHSDTYNMQRFHDNVYCAGDQDYDFIKCWSQGVIKCVLLRANNTNPITYKHCVKWFINKFRRYVVHFSRCRWNSESWRNIYSSGMFMNLIRNMCSEITFRQLLTHLPVIKSLKFPCQLMRTFAYSSGICFSNCQRPTSVWFDMI